MRLKLWKGRVCVRGLHVRMTRSPSLLEPKFLDLSLEKLRSWDRNYEEPFSLGNTHSTPGQALYPMLTHGRRKGLAIVSMLLVQSFSCWGGSRNGQYTRWCHIVWRCKFSALTATGKVVVGPPSVNLPVLWFEQLTEQMASQLTFLKHSPTKFASKHFVILTTTKKLTLECMLFYDFVLDCGYPPTCQCTHLVGEGTLFIL